MNRRLAPALLLTLGALLSACSAGEPSDAPSARRSGADPGSSTSTDGSAATTTADPPPEGAESLPPRWRFTLPRVVDDASVRPVGRDYVVLSSAYVAAVDRDGEVRWSVGTARRGGAYLDAMVSGRTVILARHTESPSRPDPLQARDVRSGRVLWRVPDAVAASTIGGQVFVSTCAMETAEDERGCQVTAYAVRTGAELWRLATDHLAQVPDDLQVGAEVPAPETGIVYTIRHDTADRLQVVDLTSGRLLGREYAGRWVDRGPGSFVVHDPWVRRAAGQRCRPWGLTGLDARGRVAWRREFRLRRDHGRCLDTVGRADAGHLVVSLARGRTALVGMRTGAVRVGRSGQAFVAVSRELVLTVDTASGRLTARSRADGSRVWSAEPDGFSWFVHEGFAWATTGGTAVDLAGGRVLQVATDGSIRAVGPGWVATGTTTGPATVAVFDVPS